MKEAGCDNHSIAKEISINDCRLNTAEEGILYLNLSPNITAGEFRLKVDLVENGPLDLAIYDMSGRLWESRANPSVLHFDEVFLLRNPAIYFLHLRIIQGQKVLKLVVVRE